MKYIFWILLLTYPIVSSINVNDGDDVTLHRVSCLKITLSLVHNLLFGNFNFRMEGNIP